MFDSDSNRRYPANEIHRFMDHYHRLTSSESEYIAQRALYLIHPKFRTTRRSPALIHDLGLIKRVQSVPLPSSIAFACLPERTDQLSDGTVALTTGWVNHDNAFASISVNVDWIRGMIRSN